MLLVTDFLHLVDGFTGSEFAWNPQAQGVDTITFNDRSIVTLVCVASTDRRRNASIIPSTEFISVENAPLSSITIRNGNTVTIDWQALYSVLSEWGDAQAQLNTLVSTGASSAGTDTMLLASNSSYSIGLRLNLASPHIALYHNNGSMVYSPSDYIKDLADVFIPSASYPSGIGSTITFQELVGMVQNMEDTTFIWEESGVLSPVVLDNRNLIFRNIEVYPSGASQLVIEPSDEFIEVVVPPVSSLHIQTNDRVSVDLWQVGDDFSSAIAPSELDYVINVDSSDAGICSAIIASGPQYAIGLRIGGGQGHLSLYEFNSDLWDFSEDLVDLSLMSEMEFPTDATSVTCSYMKDLLTHIHPADFVWNPSTRHI